MADTIHIQSNMERNSSKGIDDYYLASWNGKITVTGRLTMEEAEFSAFYRNGNIYAKANIHSNKKRSKFDL